MSKRQPAFAAPVAGAEVRKQNPSLYWLLYEPVRPRSCAVCPFGTMLSTDPENPMGGMATCKLGKHPIMVQDTTMPECHDGNWQWRAREELGSLWQRLMASDEELAEIALELGAANPTEIVAKANEALKARDAATAPAQERRPPKPKPE